MPVDDMVPDMLRRIQASLDQLREQGREVVNRLGRIETSVVAGVQVQLAEHSVRMDRMNSRLERIEKRLDLVEA
jgi:uncharacterized coiled-coil protein SlyX